jgi:hypothetical protein
MAKGESAPAKLRRLFFIFLGLTLFLNAGSLVALMYTQNVILALDQGVQPALYRTGEFVSVALEARLDLYRFLSGYTGPEDLAVAVERMQAGMNALQEMKGNAVRTVPPAEFDALGGEVRKLAKLYELIIATRTSERLAEQNLLERQLEETSSGVLTEAQGMRERLKIEVTRESGHVRTILLVGRFVFLAAMAASVLLAVGMFLMWKKFEASILGI